MPRELRCCCGSEGAFECDGEEASPAEGKPAPDSAAEGSWLVAEKGVGRGEMGALELDGSLTQLIESLVSSAVGSEYSKPCQYASRFRSPRATHLRRLCPHHHASIASFLRALLH